MEMTTAGDLHRCGVCVRDLHAGDRGPADPDNIQALLAAFKNVPTFVCSIAVLGIFGRGHWLWSRRYGLEDGISILISWTMIVTILIFIYPLKAIFGAMWNFLSNGRVGQPFSLHTTEAQARTIFAIYALGLIAISAEILLLNLRAGNCVNLCD